MLSLYKNCTVRTSPSSKRASDPTPTNLSKFPLAGLKTLNFLPVGYNFIFSQTIFKNKLQNE